MLPYTSGPQYHCHLGKIDSNPPAPSYMVLKTPLVFETHLRLVPSLRLWAPKLSLPFATSLRRTQSGDGFSEPRSVVPDVQGPSSGCRPQTLSEGETRSLCQKRDFTNPLDALRASQRLNGKESTCQGSRRRFDPWFGKIPWRRKWQPTPVCLLGKSHGQRSLVGSQKSQDMTG